MLEQRFTGLVELAQARAPCLLVIVGALGEGFAGEIVAAVHTRFVKARVVDPPAGRVNPARRDSPQYDGRRRDQRYHQVDGHEGV